MTDTSPRFSHLAIIGVGLIGGSIAAAARQRGLVDRITGIGRTPTRLDKAISAGLIDHGTTDISELTDVDLLIACTPVDRIAHDVLSAAGAISNSAILTDAGSTKAGICDALSSLDGCDGPTFVGSHPLAGSEKQGFEHARADLFVDRPCVVTPPPPSPASVVGALGDFWQSLGAEVIQMSPVDHDRALARTSHLPHLVAAALAGTLPEADRPLAATGFRDTTRIAAGDPALWVPILRHNAVALAEALAAFEMHLGEFRDSLAAADTAALQKLLEEAKRTRDELG